MIAQKKGLSEIPLIKFKNFQDLAFDYGKFSDCAITQVNLELHGYFTSLHRTNLNQQAADYMGKFLSSVGKIERLSINLSISSITVEYVAPIAQGLRHLKGLKVLEIDMSRSKIETEAFEMLANAIGVHPLQKIFISVEK